MSSCNFLLTICMYYLICTFLFQDCYLSFVISAWIWSTWGTVITASADFIKGSYFPWSGFSISSSTLFVTVVSSLVSIMISVSLIGTCTSLVTSVRTLAGNDKGPRPPFFLLIVYVLARMPPPTQKKKKKSNVHMDNSTPNTIIIWRHLEWHQKLVSDKEVQPSNNLYSMDIGSLLTNSWANMFIGLPQSIIMLQLLPWHFVGLSVWARW